MKILKITFITALFFTVLTSCTEQDLNEDDMQNTTETESVLYTGGDADE